MGFFGGGGNIAIATALPPSSFVYCYKHQIVYGFSLSHFLWLPEASVSGYPQTNPGPHRPAPAVCRILYSNVRGLVGNLSDLTVASSRYNILLCSETLISDVRHVSEVLVPGFCRPVLLCRGKMPRAILSRWLRSISPTQNWVWLLRNVCFYSMWCETEPLCVVFIATLT